MFQLRVPSSRLQTFQVWCAFLLALACGGASLAEPPALLPPRNLVMGDDFEPPEIGPGPDWVWMKNGEWLQGDIDGMTDDSIEIDSDEFGVQKLDLGDVYAVVGFRLHTFMFEKRKIVVGSFAIVEGVLKIRSTSGVQTFEAAEVLRAVQGEPRERNFWRGKLSVGITAQSGNVDQFDFSGLADFTRESTITRTNLKYNGAIGELNGDRSANNHRGTAKLDVLLTRRFYVTVPSFEVFTDEFQNIDWRIVPAVGLGYKLWDSGRFEWDAEAAVGYQYQKFASIPVGSGDDTEGTAAIIFRTFFDTDVTNDIEWSGEYKINLGVPDTSKTNHHALTTISYDLFWDLELDFTFVWDRNESPVPPDDTSPPPVKNDFRYTVGLGWDF